MAGKVKMRKANKNNEKVTRMRSYMNMDKKKTNTQNKIIIQKKTNIQKKHQEEEGTKTR